MASLVSANENYVMHIVNRSETDHSFLTVSSLKTLFVHDGSLVIKVSDGGKEETLEIEKDEGIILTPHVNFSILNFDCEMISVQSEVNDKPIIEILDMDNKRVEISLEGYKKIKNPKIVNKPWGHEIWVSWFKHHHVLKRIYMTEGNKCSLQYHEEKSETNYIVSGKANVLKDIKVMNGISEKDALKIYNEVSNIEDFISSMGPGDYWNNEPFEIHRVFSIDSYTAYEASTSELDDVIRLQDDNNRKSGFIQTEHSK